MRTIRPLALAVLGLVTASALAQAKYIPAQQRKGYTELDSLDIKADIAYLASDKLLGRLSLQPGDDQAINWIAGQFGKAGLDPIATAASGLPSYLQKFELIEYVPDREASSVTLTRGGADTVWHAPQAFGAFRHAVDISAPVVFAGYGITARELNYDDYANIDAKGKIVFVFDHEPQEDDPHSVFNGTGNTRYATARVKVLNAQAHGAVALVIVAEPNRKHPTNAERQARIGITRSTPIPLQAIADDEVKIPIITVNDEAAKLLFATSTQTGSDLQTAIDKDLFPQGRDLPDTKLTLHLVNKSERKASTANVVGLLRGSDASLSAETVIISAHHDHDGSAPCRPGQGGINQDSQLTPAGPDCIDIWHGADDNASGTAGVIAIARAFQANKARPSRSILFVVFASEERGLLGSFYMAAHPLRPLQTTRAVINFDMIGRDEKPSAQTDGLIQIPPDTSNRLNLIGALYSPDYDAIVREENQLVNLTLDNRFDYDSVLNVLFRSDQFPFLLHNIPAFWWFTGFHPDYHHPTDTVEKIDIPKMRKILQLAYLCAWRFGESQPPAFVANPAPQPAPTPSSTQPGDTDQPGAPAPNVVPVSLVPRSDPAPPPAPPPAVTSVSLAPRSNADPGPPTAAGTTPVPAPAPAAADPGMPARPAQSVTLTSGVGAAPPPQPPRPVTAVSLAPPSNDAPPPQQRRAASKVTIAPTANRPQVINPSGQPAPSAQPATSGSQP